MHGARSVNPDGTWNLTASVANTSVLRYDDAIFALVESALPYAITADLDTVGPYDFNGALKTAMTAHPKRDPATGELHFFGYSLVPPFVTYHLASADGRLLRSVPIGVTGPIMMHDFAITEHYVIWLDLPVVFDMKLASRSTAWPTVARLSMRHGTSSEVARLRAERTGPHQAPAASSTAGRSTRLEL
jgi:carotenoid cleavage dioxygenase